MSEPNNDDGVFVPQEHPIQPGLASDPNRPIVECPLNLSSAIDPNCSTAARPIQFENREGVSAGEEVPFIVIAKTEPQTDTSRRERNPADGSAPVALDEPDFQRFDQIPISAPLIVAMLLLALIGITTGAVAVLTILLGNLSLVHSLAAFFAVCSFVGLLSRRRIGWVCARVFSIANSVLWIALLIITLVPLAGAGVETRSGGSQSRRSAPALPAQPIQPAHILQLLVSAAYISLCFLTFWLLGFKSVIEYFGLICPQCRTYDPQAVDFFFTQAKCWKCGEIW